MRFQHKAAIERSTVLTLKALSRKTYLCFEEQRDTKRNVYNFVQLTAKMYLHNFSLISHFLLVMISTFRPAWLKKKKTGGLTKLSTSPNRHLSNKLSGKASESFLCFR